MKDFKKEIIKLLENLDNEKHLRYLYVLISEMVAKSSNNKRVG